MKRWLLAFLMGTGMVQGQAMHELREAAGSGQVAAQYQLAMRYDLLGFPANSLYWLFRAAKNGSGTAQYNLYQRYRTGKTVRADATQARRWLRAAACSGLVNAQTQLALEVQQTDPGEAYTWLVQASKQQYPAALKALKVLEPQLSESQKHQSLPC